VDEYNDMPKTPQLVCQHLQNISGNAKRIGKRVVIKALGRSTAKLLYLS